MRLRTKYGKLPVALLMAGSAISLIGCGETKSTVDESGDEALVSRTVEDMEITVSDNGQRTQAMRSPLVEEHAFAKAAYEEHPKGIEFIGYDSLGMESIRVVADYALHWTERDLWELKGNVVAEGTNGEEVFTQQLFWDVALDVFYSNVDSKVVNGDTVAFYEGFDSDGGFNRINGRGLKGTSYVEVENENGADSLAVASQGAVASSGAVTSQGLEHSASSSVAPENTKPANAPPSPEVAGSQVPKPASAPEPAVGRQTITRAQ